VNLLTVQNKQEIFLLASNVAMLDVSKEVHTSLISIKIAASKGVPNHHPSIPTWEKLLLRARIIHPKASHHRKRDLSLPLLRIMIADVTFVTIQITYQMLARKKASTSNLLKAN
jgi:hypothetical protein